jgi:hypothetical protein
MTEKEKIEKMIETKKFQTDLGVYLPNFNEFKDIEEEVNHDN